MLKKNTWRKDSRRVPGGNPLETADAHRKKQPREHEGHGKESRQDHREKHRPRKLDEELVEMEVLQPAAVASHVEGAVPVDDPADRAVVALGDARIEGLLLHLENNTSADAGRPLLGGTRAALTKGVRLSTLFVARKRRAKSPVRIGVLARVRTNRVYIEIKGMIPGALLHASGASQRSRRSDRTAVFLSRQMALIGRSGPS